jgi:hypothetical protein
MTEDDELFELSFNTDEDDDDLLNCGITFSFIIAFAVFSVRLCFIRK